MNYAIAQNTLPRFAVSGLFALGVTFALFAFMQFLIKSDQTPTIKPTNDFSIEIIGERPESKVKEKPPIPPKPEFKSPPPRPQTPSSSSVEPTQFAISNTPIKIDTGVSNGPTFSQPDTEASPLVRIPPSYPVAAAKDGIEGWVELQFSISPTGQVKDIKVTNAEPKRVFNRAAIKALKKWKYKPKVIDGKALAQPNQSVVLSFELNKAAS